MAKSKKSSAKKPAARAPVRKPAPKAKPAPPAKSVRPAPAASTKAPALKAKPALSAADLKRRILGLKTAPKAIAFSLDEVREIAKKNEKQLVSSARSGKGGKAVANTKHSNTQAKTERPHKPHHVKPASLADILGFTPGRSRKPRLTLAEKDVPEKFRRYYRLLIDLRNHVLTKLGEHTEDTLLKSAKEDSGDLSGYGQHMADAGTDTFDRDFALSLVSSEQEALAEIEAAIKRIHLGTYGVCEVTQKPIAKDRLLAVPFTRYSTEAQKQVERHSHRSVQRGGLFGDTGEEDAGGKVADEDAGED
jgi:RNA polymerase-binding transcription factor DksA